MSEAVYTRKKKLINYNDLSRYCGPYDFGTCQDDLGDFLKQILDKLMIDEKVEEVDIVSKEAEKHGLFILFAMSTNKTSYKGIVETGEIADEVEFDTEAEDIEIKYRPVRIVLEDIYTGETKQYEVNYISLWSEGLYVWKQFQYMIRDILKENEPELYELHLSTADPIDDWFAPPYRTYEYDLIGLVYTEEEITKGPVIRIWRQCDVILEEDGIYLYMQLKILERYV